MSYTPTVWKSGDVVSSLKLNKLENGVKNNSDDLDEVKNTLMPNIELTLSGGNIGINGAVHVDPSSVYYFISQAIDVANVGMMRISNFYYGPALATYTILDANGGVLDFLVNPSASLDYIDVIIPTDAAVAYVQATSSLTPEVVTVISYSKSDIADYLVEENTPL